MFGKSQLESNQVYQSFAGGRSDDGRIRFFFFFFFQRMEEQLRDSLESFNTEDIDKERNNTEEYRHVGVSPHNYNRVSEGQKKPHMSGSYGLSQKYDCAKKQRVTRGEDSPV